MSTKSGIALQDEKAAWRTPVSDTLRTNEVKLHFGAFLPSLDYYSTQFVNFPGAQACEPWPTRGDFWGNIYVYQKGKLAASVSVPHVNEDGILYCDLNWLEGAIEPDTFSLMVVELFETEKIPTDLYISHVHKKSGMYLSYPALAFMGDVIHPETHRTQLENSLFWPGVLREDRCESGFLVMNPYNVPISYQFALFRPDGGQTLSNVHKLSARQLKSVRAVELFPELAGYKSSQSGYQYSVCLSSQHKIIAYHCVQDVESGVLTSVDHLHTYCLV